MRLMTVPRGTRPLAAVFGVAATALLTTGCGLTDKPYAPTPPSESNKALVKLLDLPSLEDTQRQVQAAVDQIVSAASSLMPGIAWAPKHGTTSAGCPPPYEGLGGELMYLPDQVSTDIPVSEQDWAKIYQIAHDTASKLGTTGVEINKNAPGNHDVRFFNDTGTAIILSYQGNLVISGDTGCRLPKDKSRSAAPSPSTTGHP
ncbi:LppA family lipoprotein [Nocardia sp. CA-107356]|uniref:LppA family lipoprotein n=1 Tax=Nocardia sp. CA-107356 TaxID=3239972 RepID=UPI003D8C1242